MKRFVYFLILAAMMVGCKSNSTKAVPTDQEVVDDMVDIDEMVNLEYIIADSSLMDVKGNISWHPINDRLIRIKKGNRYYLRMQTEKETVTSVTYKYDDNSNNK